MRHSVIFSNYLNGHRKDSKIRFQILGDGRCRRDSCLLAPTPRAAYKRNLDGGSHRSSHLRGLGKFRPRSVPGKHVRIRIRHRSRSRTWDGELPRRREARVCQLGWGGWKGHMLPVEGRGEWPRSYRLPAKPVLLSNINSRVGLVGCAVGWGLGGAFQPKFVC